MRTSTTSTAPPPRTRASSSRSTLITSWCSCTDTPRPRERGYDQSPDAIGRPRGYRTSRTTEVVGPPTLTPREEPERRVAIDAVPRCRDGDQHCLRELDADGRFVAGPGRRTGTARAHACRIHEQRAGNAANRGGQARRVAARGHGVVPPDPRRSGLEHRGPSHW